MFDGYSPAKDGEFTFESPINQALPWRRLVGKADCVPHLPRWRFGQKWVIPQEMEMHGEEE